MQHVTSCILLATLPRESDGPVEREPTADGEETLRRNRNHSNLKSLNKTERLFWCQRNQQKYLESAGGRDTESPLYGDEWKRANVKWMKREVTDVAATSGA